MAAPRSGHNALIYVSGTEMVGANAWSIDFDTDAIETPQFGDTWKKHVMGMSSWSGSLTLWDQGDDQVAQAAAIAGTSIALLVYPSNADTATYYSGNAIFSFGSSGDTGSAVSNTASFTGDDTLEIAGFA